MLHVETIVIDDVHYRRTYSNAYKIMREGVEYDEAIDPIDANRTYTESNTLKTEQEDFQNA